MLYLRLGWKAFTLLFLFLGLAGCNGFFVDGHTATIVSSSVVSAAYETSITLTAKVYTNGVLASGTTGTVAFYVDSTELGTATLSSGQATYTTAAMSVGTHTVYGVYEGDSTYNASTSDDLTVVISQTLTTTTTAVSVSSSTAAYGSSVTMTAVVDISAATGTVTFYDDTTGAPVVLGTGSLSGGTASISSASLSVGSHAIYATYIGDSNYSTSTSGSVAMTVTAAS